MESSDAFRTDIKGTCSKTCNDSPLSYPDFLTKEMNPCSGPAQAEPTPSDQFCSLAGSGP